MTESPGSPEQFSADLPAAESIEQPAKPQKSEAKELLDQVIDRSVSQFSKWLDGESLVPLLREIAKRYPGQAFSTNPVATELVLSALVSFWADNKPGAREFWRVVAYPVAESLVANPSARQRLERLWDELNAA